MLVRKKVESGLNNDGGWTPAGAKSLSRQEGKACSVISICLISFLTLSRFLFKCPLLRETCSNYSVKSPTPFSLPSLLFFMAFCH